jgi:type IX secretion system PorP/SprF family membrane protein
MRIIFILIISIIFSISIANGQDVQFSQFYAAPLYLNPAFTGTTYQSRATLNYRNQWPASGKPFITYAGSFDHYIAKYNSGVGLMVMQNKAGNSRLQSTEISGLYSYHISLSETWNFIPAIQATFVQRSIDYSKVTFPDQYDNTGLVGSTTEDLNLAKKNYMDFSAGGLLFSEIFWFGTSYHHLNRPDQSFTNSSQSRLPGEFNAHAGARIPFASRAKGRRSSIHYKEKALMPSVLYKAQGKFDQLDLGLNVLYEPLIFGVWYRGLPIKHYSEGYSNAESIIGSVGVNFNGITIGYSYDFVISRLNNATTAGAHELSLSYQFGNEQVKKKKVRYKKIPCPGFYKKF